MVKTKIPLDAILSLSASKALDFIDNNYLVVLAFAKRDDVFQAWNVVAKKCSFLKIQIVHVEPTEESAVDLQIIKHPSYILYRTGNEDWSVVGTNAFIEKIDALRS